MVTRFWWLRHGRVDGPAGRIHPADAPILPPDPRAVQALKTRLPSPALWLTSPTLRARQTVKALTHSRPIPLPALAEQDFGGWTGRFHAEIEAEDPEYYRRFWQQAGDNAPPDGESFAAQCRRVADAVTALATEHQGLDLVLVAHSGTIRAALAQALDLPPEAALRFVVDPLSLTRLDHVAGGWRVGTVNRPVLSD